MGALVLAACGPEGSPAHVPTTSRDGLADAHAPPAAPSTSAAPIAASRSAPPPSEVPTPPEVTLSDTRAIALERALQGLPAVSSDGALVAVEQSDALPGRIDVRTSLELLDVKTDHAVISIPLSDPDTELPADRAERALAALAPHTWTPLRALSLREDEGAPLRHGGTGSPHRARLAEGFSMSVAFREPTLVVRAREHVILRKRTPAFSLPSGERCPGCGVCPAPLAGLEAAFVDGDARVLVVLIAYTGGSDHCWELPSRFHVVRVPAVVLR